MYLRPAFETDDGEQVTLSAPKTQLLFNQNTGQYYHPSGTPYNPANSFFGGSYTLTTKEGIEYKIDGQSGDLLTVTDTNGNTLTYSESGISSDTGVSVTFQRDATGRIVSVTDPEGNQINYGYDEAGDLVSVTDAEEYVTKFVYDVPNQAHYLNEIIDPLNRPAVRSEYQEDGRLKKIIDVDGDPVEFVYNPDNSTQTVKDASGNPTLYEYDSRGNVIQQVNALGHSTRLEYDDNNNVTRATDANGNVANYTYDNEGNLLSRTEFHAPDETNPEITRYTYNQFGQTTKVILPTGAIFSMEYDDSGNLLAMLDSEENAIQSYVYDQYGRVVEESDSTGSNYYGNFDAFGNPRWSKDAFGEETTMTYDAKGQLVSMNDNDGTYTFEYDGRGRQTRADYGDGIWVEYGYGAEQDWTSLNAPTIGYIERRFTDDGKLGGWLTPGGGEIVFNYDKAGRLSEEIDPSGQVTRYEYDKIGRVERVIDSSTGLETINHYDSLVGIDPDPGVADNLIGKLSGRTVTLDADTSYTTSSTYYPSGNVKTSTDAGNNTWHYGYTSTTSTLTDPLGRETTTIRSPEYLPIETVYADGTRETIEYLYNNNLQEAKDYPTVITDRAGNDRHYTYDELGRLQAATDLGDTLYGFRYEGNDYSVQSPTGETLLRYDYNDDRNLEIVTYLDGGKQELTYSETGNRLEKVVLPSGFVVNYEYASSDLERRRTVSLNGETVEEIVSDWNETTGQLQSITDATGTTIYNYDSLTGALSGIDYANGGSIDYDRDLLGRVERVTVLPSESATPYETTYSYDAAGNLLEIDDPYSDVPTTMTYDGVNRLVERTLPNGVKTVYEYKENTDFLEKITHLAADGVTVLSSVKYDRAASGEPTKIVREDGSYLVLDYGESLRVKSETYYDAAGAEVDKIEYEYDAAGNRQAVSSGQAEGTYSYDNVHQLTEIQTASGTESYSYDAGGRLETVDRDGVSLQLEYDENDQLTAVKNADGSAVVEYAYDSEGRRVEASDGTGTRQVIVAPSSGSGLESPHLIANGSDLEVFAYAGNEPLMRVDDRGNATYYLTDALGSVIGLVDGNGQEVADFRYDSFGNLQTPSELPSELGGDFRFQGQWLESNTDFYHFRARYYDPETGRFISRDPVEIIERIPESSNPYQFVYNNPHVYSDPTGAIATISEFNIRNVIENILNHVKTEAVGYLRDEAQGVVTNLALDFLKKILPVQADYIQRIDDFISAGKDPGVILEQFIVDIGVCPVIEAAGFDTWFHREPVILPNGQPKTNGFKCSEDPVSGGKFPKGLKDPTKPDFLISRTEPKSINPLSFDKAWLIGDFKINTRKVREGVQSTKKKQWPAISNFAKGYQYIPTALYITLYQNLSQKDLEQTKKDALSDGVTLFILPLTDVPGPKKK